MGQLIHKIWDLHRSMWLHRNSFVHHGKQSVHSAEREAIDYTLHQEYATCHDGLDASYIGLFQIPIAKLLAKDDVSKLQWLDSVWAGRDRLRKDMDLEPCSKDPLAAAFLHRSKRRQKQRRGR